MNARLTSVTALPEEMLSKLCNIALEKCHDKEERRRAGCGGTAMRKRVLIKNFVADLLRTQGGRVRNGSLSPVSSEEDEAEWEEPVQEDDEEDSDEEEEIILRAAVPPSLQYRRIGLQEETRREPIQLPPLAPQTRPYSDSDRSICHYSDYIDTKNGMKSDMKMASEDRLWVYDMYGSDSEGAYVPRESAWAPVEGWTVTYEGIDENAMSPYEQPLYIDAMHPSPGATMCYSEEMLFASGTGPLPNSGSLLRPSNQTNTFFALQPAITKNYNSDMSLPEDVTEDHPISPLKRCSSTEFHSSPSKRIKA